MTGVLLLWVMGCGAEIEPVEEDPTLAVELIDCAGIGQEDPSGVCVHGADCLDILDRSGEDGLYRIDPDGLGEGDDPFVVYCDMTTEGGGWTGLTGPLFERRGWLEFEHVAGEGDPWMGWDGEGAFLLAPEGARGCDTMALRATVWLPFIFQEWWGHWVGAGGTEASQHDDVQSRLAWGEVTDDCTGHLKFGTDQDDLKVGGEWGQHWSARDAHQRRFVWDIRKVAPTSVIRWEVMDQGSPEDVRIQDVAIWIR